MPERTDLLTDVASGVFREDYSLSAADGLSLAGASAWSVERRTLRGGESDGVEVVELNNGRLSLSILATRGMGLWKGRVDDVEIGWASPVERPVHPDRVDLSERNGLGWLTGFNELLCRCGLSFNGAPGDDDGGNALESPLTLHGRIANTPAHHVAVEVTTAGAGRIAVTGVVDEAMMFGPRLRLTSRIETEAGSTRFRIRDEVANLGAQPAEMELLYHLNLGRPLLEAGARFFAAAREVAPRDDRAADGVKDWPEFSASAADYAEQVYFVDPLPDADGRAVVLLRNAAGDQGLSLEIDAAGLPYFTLWKNTRAEADGYVCGLEPSTDFPNHRSFERGQGRLVVLPPGETHVCTFDVEVQTTQADVSAVEQRIAQIQGDLTPVVHPQPKPGWSPTV